MKKSTRTVCWDEQLQLEAYRFQGIAQPFPRHFHEHYVIGLVEGGQRILSCQGGDYKLERGHIVLFNPGDPHACVQGEGGTFDYRGFNISPPVMQALTQEITGQRLQPRFAPPALRDEELACGLRSLHRLVMEGSGEFRKEEELLLMLTRLLQGYSHPFRPGLPECRAEIEEVCAFLQDHYAEPITLDRLCRCAALSKPTLIRSFTKAKGVTPYRYLQTLRINRAKLLLEQGVPTAQAALRTGFADQSHFTNFFSSFIGLTPGAYREIFLKKPPAEEEQPHDD